jgi:tRNA N6-adenosine threonylcarbamoyltransferase
MADIDDYTFSLSGLKIAVLRYGKAEREAGREIVLADLAASFQEEIIDVQVAKTMRAARETDVSTVLLGGGVVANSRLPERMSAAATENAIEVRRPPVELCTDNLAMIAGASRIARGDRTDLRIAADPAWELGLIRGRRDSV